MWLRLAASLMASTVAACAAPELYRARAPLGSGVGPEGESPPAPRISSAHVSRTEPAGAEELLLVFSSEVDPATLDARAFVIIQRDGGLVIPSRALLDPADEGDENRSVTLVGGFGLPDENPPVAVRVIGSLYGEDGSSMAGLDAQVRSYAEADELIAVEIVAPEEHRCAGAQQVVRTYWTDNLRGVEPEDLERVRATFADGTDAAPAGFDDHADLGGEQPAPDDNVLDLCFARDAPVSAVTVQAGAFTDPGGHPTAETSRGPDGGRTSVAGPV